MKMSDIDRFSFSLLYKRSIHLNGQIGQLILEYEKFNIIYHFILGK